MGGRLPGGVLGKHDVLSLVSGVVGLRWGGRLLKQIVKHITGVVSNYGCWELHSQLLSKYV